MHNFKGLEDQRWSVTIREYHNIGKMIFEPSINDNYALQRNAEHSTSIIIVSIVIFSVHKLNTSFRSILIEHAEVALHHMFGNKVYWKARRSMRFNKDLKNIAAEFRKSYLKSTDEDDHTILPDNWLNEKVFLLRTVYDWLRKYCQ